MSDVSGVKERILRTGAVGTLGRISGKRFGSPYVATEKIPDYVGRQKTVSEGHPFDRRKSGGLTGDIGGPFFSQKRYVESGISILKGTYDGASLPQHGDFITFHGPAMVCIPPNGSFSEWPTDKIGFPSSSLEGNLDALGATAISRCSPTNSVANAATFLGELMKDGLPSIIGSQTWKGRTATARSAGSEYLNVQFGWLPLVNDVQKFAKGVSHASTVMKQFERDAGKVVRRRYNFPLIVETSEEGFGSGNARTATWPTNSDMWSQAGGRQVTRRREIVRSRWFSGAFTYHLPYGYDSRKAMDSYALLADRLGLSLTPETLWELAPWSWAVDWFSNVGDVVKNVSNFITYGLVMHHGYMMDHTIVKDTYTAPTSGLQPEFGSPDPLVLVTETKIRRQAHPFGFGVSWDGLSPFQASILAALGLSRK